MSESGFGMLYDGELSGDHRLYQNVASGFGGYQALKAMNICPAVIQLNETATIFAAVARLDELVSHGGMNLHEAIVYVRKSTLYTNHTLLQAAEVSLAWRSLRNLSTQTSTAGPSKNGSAGCFAMARCAQARSRSS